jgi:hypothetical protein
VPAPGEYEVQLWWTRLSNRRTDVPVRIVHTEGTKRVTVDQTRNGGRWNRVAVLGFAERAVIVIESLGGGLTTCADAVRLVRVNRAPLAVLEVIDPDISLRGDTVLFMCHGRDEDGSIAAYLWSSSIDGELSREPWFETEDLTAGDHVITLRVQDDRGAWSAPVTRALHVEPLLVDEVILDDDEPGVSHTGGTWRPSRAQGFYGEQSLYSSREGATYTFALQVPAPAEYEVYLWWTQYSNRRNDVPVTIDHAGGTRRVTIDQTRNGGRWNRVATLSFTNQAVVTIHSLGGGLTTCADAVRIFKVAP